MADESRRRRVLGILILVEAALLYATATSFAARGTLYGCPLLCGTQLQRTTGVFAGLFGAAMFVLPVMISALCRTWQSGIALAVAPWFIAVVAHAGTLLAPSNSADIMLGPYFRLGSPFWVDPVRIVTLLLSLALFTVLGWIGWLARQARSA